jgi:probable HAF family extracellular repeat protein
MKLLLSATALAAALSASTAVQAGSAPRYRIEYLPTLGGSSSANSINNFGWIAGRSALPASAEAPARRRAVLWRHGQVRDLGTLGGPESAVQWPSKNLRGMITGIAETGVIDIENEAWSCSAFLLGDPDPDAPRHQCLGFVWENGRMRPLPTFGGTHGFATGSNNLGQVVGWAETTERDPENCVLPQKFRFLAALWEPRHDRMRALPPLRAKGDSVSAATAINDRGQAVGISGICDDAVGKFSAIHAVMWENGRVYDLGNIGGDSWNTPNAINLLGDVVGFANQSENDDGALDWAPFLWTRWSGMKKLPVLAGHQNGEAKSINLWRQIVGRSCTDASMGACEAVLWRSGQVHRLRDLIAGFPADGPRLSIATDIDDFGRISGQALDLQTGAGIAFVAVPMH